MPARRGLPMRISLCCSPICWERPGHQIDAFRMVERRASMGLWLEEQELAARLRTADSETELIATESEGQIRRLLDGTIEALMVYLHPSQRSIARSEFNGPARVRGGPGTGKTVVALHRARRLARFAPDVNDVVQAIRDGELQPRAPLSRDVLDAAPEQLSPLVRRLDMADGQHALQLDRLANDGALIRKQVEGRLSGRRHALDLPWRRLIDEQIGSLVAPGDREEERARREKAIALE